MIWQNPFHIRCTEKIDTDENFLQLFNAEILSSIDGKSFSMIQFVRSTPGAGKTTLFKSLQPGILSSLKEDDGEMNVFYKKAMQYGVIDKEGVKLLSCIISCAKNYDFIDSLFQNGRRQQVLFALLNVRITVLLLKNIMNILDFADVSELEKITFADYPEEFIILDKPIKNGYKLFLWAQDEERKICRYLDELSDEKTNFTFMYNDFFFLKLFEPHNIFYNGNNFLNYSLVIFDDAHKLTFTQRKLVITTLCNMRLKTGVWIGERIEALSYEEIVTQDAAENRDYISIHLEDLYRKKKEVFHQILSTIADKRVKLNDSEQIKTFDNCFNNTQNYKDYKNKLETFINETIKTISPIGYINVDYNDVIKNITNKASDIYIKALDFAVLLIKFNRDFDNMQLNLLPMKYDIDEFETFYKDNRSVAEYYLCEKIGMPYYYGKERIFDISSFNIEQFLAFAGEIFGKCVSEIIVGKKKNISIKPYEQQRIIKKIAESRFEEITKRFSCGEGIQNLLNNLCNKSLQTRDEWKNSYSGGTVTGVGILKHRLDDITQDDTYSELLYVLSSAISANYIEKRNINQGGQKWVVFYYNRWVCVHYNLPLNYGGWFKTSLDELNSFIKKKNIYKNEILEAKDYDNRS
jgi:hypothetical protein